MHAAVAGQPQSFRNKSDGRSGEVYQIQVEDFEPDSKRGDTDLVRGAIWLLHPALDQESDSTTTSAQGNSLVYGIREIL